MSLDRSNFFSPQDTKTVKVATGTQVTPAGTTPVVNPAEAINPGQQSNTNTGFGTGKSSAGTPSSQQYPYGKK